MCGRVLQCHIYRRAPQLVRKIAPPVDFRSFRRRQRRSPRVETGLDGDDESLRFRPALNYVAALTSLLLPMDIRSAALERFRHANPA
jgi:hypothetical protein